MLWRKTGEWGNVTADASVLEEQLDQAVFALRKITNTSTNSSERSSRRAPTTVTPRVVSFSAETRFVFHPIAKRKRCLAGDSQFVETSAHAYLPLHGRNVVACPGSAFRVANISVFHCENDELQKIKNQWIYQRLSISHPTPNGAARKNPLKVQIN